MRLLVITQKYDIDDSNLGVFVDWWNRIAEKIEKVYVLALEKRSDPSLSNMEVFGMGKESGAGFWGKIFGFYAGIFGVIRKSDAILVHMVPKYVILAAPVAFIFGKPIYMWYTGVAAHWQLKLAVIFCRKIFTAHEAAMRIDTSKRIVTGHGIDIQKFKNQKSKIKIDEEITILTVGRITPSKGHDLIIKAVSDLVKDGYNIRLKIIGGVIQEKHKEYLKILGLKTKELGIENQVEFVGAVPYGQMPEYFDQADILINAVPFGGLDKVVLEAMAAGVLPVTSNSAFSSVFPEVSGKNLIFKSGNLGDLKIKLNNIIENKIFEDGDLRLKLREAVVKNHNLDVLIGRIINEIKI